MTTDYRALCAELESHLSALSWSTLNIASNDEAEHDLAHGIAELCSRARAALAQPEPVGPTDDALMAAARAAVDTYPRASELPYFMDPAATEYEPMLLALRAAAAMGRPAITPIPVSERLPGEGDCDAEGRCWLWVTEGYDFLGRWVLVHRLNTRDGEYTHWLPAHALPLPPP